MQSAVNDWFERDDRRFYMTYARSRPDDIVPYAEANQIGLMTNAAHRWSDAKGTFLDMWGYDTHRIVDSGGYNVQSNYGGFPWSVREYHEWLTANKDQFDWAACMDLACEERFDHLHTVDERMGKTLDNTIEQFDMDPEYDLRPVIQGRSVEDYIAFYDRLEDHGIPTESVGLGTVCRISSSKEIVETEREIRERCKNVEEIHGFGVKIQAFKMGATFDTADSQAWVYAASNGNVYLDKGDRLETKHSDDSRRRTVESFKNYHSYVSRLISGDGLGL